MDNYVIVHHRPSDTYCSLNRHYELNDMTSDEIKRRFGLLPGMAYGDLYVKFDAVDSWIDYHLPQFNHLGSDSCDAFWLY